MPTASRRTGILLSLCVFSMLVACISAAIGVFQLIGVRDRIAEIERISTVSTTTGNVLKSVWSALPGLTAITLDLSSEERLEVLGETNQRFAELESQLMELWSMPGNLISEQENDVLTHAIRQAADSWEEIREQSAKGLAPAERTFHFLAILGAINRTSDTLASVEVEANKTVREATQSTVATLEKANLILIFVLTAAATISLIAGFGMFRHAQEVQRVNSALHEKNREIRLRDKRLTVQNDRFDAALSNMSQGLCMFDNEQRLVVCNGRYSDLLGLPPALTDPGTPYRAIVEHQASSNCFSTTRGRVFREEQLSAVLERQPSHKVVELLDGRVIATFHQPMGDGGWVATHEDVTEVKRIEAQITHMAHHDALTDLPNRALLLDRLEQALPLARRGQALAVLYLDLDRFKTVNDTLGHPVGDQLLKAVAERLSSCVRESDTVARMGGDEFVIVQVSLNQPLDATTLASRVRSLISKPFDLEGRHVTIDTSIGITMAPLDGDDPNQLLKNADLALYRAKSDGRGVYRFFEPEMDALMQERRVLELDLQRALAEDEFELHYQPIIDLEANAVSGFEALLRWRHPERGMIPPDAFIPIAEEIGLVVPLGQWVIEQVCSEAASWPSHVKVAANVSPVQFQDENLVPSVIGALASSGIGSARLELEITEAALLLDSSSTLKKLHELRDLGVRIAMDDFGTGYSSLSYLRSFPFDKIKLDRSFVSHEAGETEANAIIEAVAGLSRNLGIATTAEGVETHEQLQRVRSARYTEAQGYLFSRPMPPEEIHDAYFSCEETAKLFA